MKIHSKVLVHTPVHMYKNATIHFLLATNYIKYIEINYLSNKTSLVIILLLPLIYITYFYWFILFKKQIEQKYINTLKKMRF
jgi:hypothetical protein